MKGTRVEDKGHDIYDLGLQADVTMMTRSPLERRRILKMGALGIGLLLTGCATAAAQTQTSTSQFLPLVANPATATTTPITACVTEIPQETAGPYPADGSNASNQSLNVLTRSGIVRSDIRTSLGTGNTAQGIPLTIELTIVNTSADCAPLAGYAIYIWHCDRGGNYSLYSNGVTSEDYLRGVQATDSSGKVTFTSIFPACYSGRWPHVHFEIYPSLASATASSNAIHTTQLALPEDICNTVYATSGYSASVQNLSQVTLDTDNVFRDGHSLQLATVTGDLASGYTAQLTVGVEV
jgi:protocatechuate 3,4-dioxygenase beta subunit